MGNVARKVGIWCDVSASLAEGDGAMEAALHAPIDVILARPEQLAEVELSPRIRRACLVDDPIQLAGLVDGADIAVVSDRELGEAVRSMGMALAVRTVVSDGETLERARQAARVADYLLVSLTDETNIPLELLLAEAQSSTTKIVKEVDAYADAAVTLGVLESGPSGVLFPVRAVAEISRLTSMLREVEQGALELVEAEVLRSRSVGMGHRACIDTVSLLDQDEGMIVGSTSAGGFLVCAEVHHLPYMNLRPFRVNAGAVHSYVWGGDVAEYLTDLSAGSRVLGVNTDGVTRPLVVGRVKTEVRSLRLIEAIAGETLLSLFIQDDWHVRLFDAERRPRNCTTLVPGDRLLAYTCRAGRHVGIPVDETIEER